MHKAYSSFNVVSLANVAGNSPLKLLEVRCLKEQQVMNGRHRICTKWSVNLASEINMDQPNSKSFRDYWKGLTVFQSGQDSQALEEDFQITDWTPIFYSF